MTAVGWKSRRFEGTNEGDTLQSDAGLRPPCFDGDEVTTLLISRTRNRKAAARDSRAEFGARVRVATEIQEENRQTHRYLLFNYSLITRIFIGIIMIDVD